MALLSMKAAPNLDPTFGGAVCLGVVSAARLAHNLEAAPLTERTLIVKSVFVVLLLSLVLLPACGKAPGREKNGGSSEFQEYGKPGPGTGEACYVGPSMGAHSCVEAQTGDKASIKILNSYCASFEGQRGKGACKTDGHMGTCRFMTDAPNMKIRFYGQTFQQAKAACTEEGGTLYSAY